MSYYLMGLIFLLGLSIGAASAYLVLYIKSRQYTKELDEDLSRERAEVEAYKKLLAQREENASYLRVYLRDHMGNYIHEPMSLFQNPYILELIKKDEDIINEICLLDPTYSDIRKLSLCLFLSDIVLQIIVKKDPESSEEELNRMN